jgi:hypothetical protein
LISHKTNKFNCCERIRKRNRKRKREKEDKRKIRGKKRSGSRPMTKKRNK